MEVQADKLGLAIAAAARAQVGTTEWAQGSNPQIENYWKQAGLTSQPDDVPWCAVFVGAALGAVGILGSGKPNARSYKDWGSEVAIEDLAPGDVIVSWRESPSSWKGHVEIVVEVRGREVVTVGGNEGNAVREAPYNFDKFLCARRAPRPRAKPIESRTVQASVADVVVKAGTGIGALAALDGTAQIVALGVGGLGLILTAIIFRERLKAFAAGWR
jgi:uncharacterized protein (TIGR02594 family)